MGGLLVGAAQTVALDLRGARSWRSLRRRHFCARHVAYTPNAASRRHIQARQNSVYTRGNVLWGIFNTRKAPAVSRALGCHDGLSPPRPRVLRAAERPVVAAPRLCSLHRRHQPAPKRCCVRGQGTRRERTCGPRPRRLQSPLPPPPPPPPPPRLEKTVGQPVPVTSS